MPQSLPALTWMSTVDRMRGDMFDPLPADWAAGAGAAVLAEVAFPGDDGALDAAVVVPLRLSDGMVLAFPYAERRLAEQLAAAPAVAVTLTEPRLAARPFRPVAAVARCRLEPDPDGSRFVHDLLHQELRKHPPSRVLADSLMARRDHWWYLPRLLVHVDPVAVVAVAARRDPTDAVLAWSQAASVRATTVATRDWESDRVAIAVLDGSPVPPPAAPHACLLRIDVSEDLERRIVAVAGGRLDGGELRVSRRRGDPRLPPPPSLLERLRAQRALERACRRELAR
jgi:hypothetical protein